MIQLILHLFGDYVTQSDWMANNKTKSFDAAFAHALIYSLPFWFIGSASAWVVIFTTHFLIDRYRLARFVVFAKNFLGDGDRSKPHKWSECSKTGYPPQKPDWLAVWLLIACDNTLHLAINYAAIRYL